MWSLYEQEKSLKPLIFSSGKNQEDIVNEVLEAVKQRHKVIFIKGVCGTGKSAIALNIAKNLGRASIVVPFKALQKQYEQDYTKKKYLLKDNNEKLKISIITGRQNHTCPFLSEHAMKQEYNMKLSTWDNIESFQEKNDDSSCDNPFLPCKIDIKEKNFHRIRKYLEDSKQNLNIKDIKRMTIAPTCPYWNPIYPAEFEIQKLGKAKKEDYMGLDNIKFTYFKRGTGCGYYDQFSAYLDSDVIIFNSHKYNLETVMNRKPYTDVEIVDECDEFLDSFVNQKKININRLNFALSSIFPEQDKHQKIINSIMDLTRQIIFDNNTLKYIETGQILHIKDTKILELLRFFIDEDIIDFVEDEENYAFHCDEVAQAFFDFLEDTYITFHKEDKDLIVNLITPNLEKKFQELVDKNNILVLMSGTLHSEQVLKSIFGLKNFKIIEAETTQPGKIEIKSLGSEMDCSYENFRNQNNREHYLKVLSRCVEVSKKPALVHVTSFKDLPTKEEKEVFNITNLPSQKDLSNEQEMDTESKSVLDFKQGNRQVLFTTKCNRGADFPGEMCNSIIITRFPYPQLNSLFWQVFKKTHPDTWRTFYIDKAHRELLQKVYRGIRFQNDHIYLLSPDKRVLNFNFQFPKNI